MRSHINVAKFTKRIPTEQFAYEEYSLEAAIDSSESGEEVLIEMRKQVSSAFAADLVESTEQPAEKPAKKGKKNGKSKANPTDDEDQVGEDGAEDSSGDGEGAEDDEAADDSAGDGSDDYAEDDEDGDAGEDQDEESEEDGDGDEAEEEKPARKAGKNGGKSSGKKTFKKKPQVYNRNIEQHRAIFSRCLGSVKPDWKEKLKDKAKQVSQKLEGKPFLDENGEVLPEFKAEVKKLLLGKK